MSNVKKGIRIDACFAIHINSEMTEDHKLAMIKAMEAAAMLFNDCICVYNTGNKEKP